MNVGAAQPIGKRSDAERRATAKGRLWPVAIVGLLLLNVSICAVTVYNAVRDPSAVSEPSYYTKAMNWDADRAAWPEAELRGLRAQVSADAPVSAVILALVDDRGEAVDVRDAVGEAFHRARGGDRRTLSFVAAAGDPPSSVRAPCEFDRDGLWEVRVRAMTSRGAVSVRRVIEVTW